MRSLLCAALVAAGMQPSQASLFPVSDAEAAARAELAEVTRRVPDPARGAGIFERCRVCHAPGAKALPSGWAPAIAGQHVRVLEKELIDYRHALRWDERMERIAGPHMLGSPQDIADVASYAASLPFERADSVGEGSNLAAGRRHYQRSCERCHGARGEGSNLRGVPRLAGQRYDYLLRQLHDVVDGRRPNLEANHVRLLRPLERGDLEGLADYASRLSPGASDGRAIAGCAAGQEELPGRLSDPRIAAALRTLYPDRRSWHWSSESGPSGAARAMLARLVAADVLWGLRPTDYDTEALQGLQAPEFRSRFERLLSAALARLLLDLHSGRVDPAAAGLALDAPRAPFDPVPAILQLAAGADPQAVIAAAEPPFLHYRLLEQSLPRYRALALRPRLTRLPAPAHAVRPGDPYAGAPALRRLLAALGDLPESQADAPGAALDAPLSAAVAHFQERHGLRSDGIIGRSTYAALTVPLAMRVRQIELTLERWRWLPGFSAPPIIVNIPQFRAFAFRSKEDRKAQILQLDVIVGRTFPQLQTPMFSAQMRSIIFRPYWDVPASIARRELLPRIRRRPGTLEAEHLEIVAGQGDDVKVVPPTPANLAALMAGRLRLRQRPGLDNALGLIKFMLPNRYDVYLHATPAHQLFSESRRAFSHGCIRVSEPVALAVQVLQGTPGDWTADKVEAAMNDGRTEQVTLARPVPVFVLYGTALATESGEIDFFEDLYGQDRRLETLLGLPPALP